MIFRTHCTVDPTSPASRPRGNTLVPGAFHHVMSPAWADRWVARRILPGAIALVSSGRHGRGTRLAGRAGI